MVCIVYISPDPNLANEAVAAGVKLCEGVPEGLDKMETKSGAFRGICLAVLRF